MNAWLLPDSDGYMCAKSPCRNGITVSYTFFKTSNLPLSKTFNCQSVSVSACKTVESFIYLFI